MTKRLIFGLVMLVLLPFTYASVDPTGLDAWYEFNASNAVDTMGNYTGTVYAPVTWVNGGPKPGYYNWTTAAPGNGNITIPQADGGLKGQTSLTLAYLMNIRSCSTADELTGISGWMGGAGEQAYALRYDCSTNTIECIINTGSATIESEAVAIEDGDWHHIGCTWSGSGGIQIYLDGSPVGAPGAKIGTIQSGTANVLIGKLEAADYMIGALDEVMIWSRNLSSAEMSNLNSSLMAGTDPRGAAPVPPVVSNTFYVDSITGNDANPGNSTHPIKTLAELNTLTTLGSQVFLNGTWESPLDDYLDVYDGMLIDAWGEWLIKGSINVSGAACWTDIGSNIYRYNCAATYKALTTQIAAVFYDNGNGALDREQYYSGLNANGEFQWTSPYVYIYSNAGNPATVYGDLELAEFYGEGVINYNNANDVVFANGTVAYGGRHGFKGIDVENITFYNMTVHNIGSNYNTVDSGGQGNCIEAGLGVSGLTITHSHVYNCWDACVSDQAWNSGNKRTIEDVYMAYNILEKCGYAYEHLNSYSTSEEYNKLFEHNTMSPDGSVFEPIGSDSPRCFVLATSPVTSSNITFRNNVCLNSTRYMHDYGMGSWDAPTSIDYNIYTSAYTIFMHHKYDTGSSPTYTFAQWQSVYGYDTNSAVESNLYMSDDYVPTVNSPLCGAAHDGSDVGAIPCLTTPPPNRPPTMVYDLPNVSIYGASKTLSYNITCNDSNLNYMVFKLIDVNGVTQYTAYKSNISTTIYNLTNTIDISSYGNGYYTAYALCSDSSYENESLSYNVTSGMGVSCVSTESSVCPGIIEDNGLWVYVKSDRLRESYINYDLSVAPKSNVVLNYYVSLTVNPLATTRILMYYCSDGVYDNSTITWASRLTDIDNSTCVLINNTASTSFSSGSWYTQDLTSYAADNTQFSIYWAAKSDVGLSTTARGIVIGNSTVLPYITYNTYGLTTEDNFSIISQSAMTVYMNNTQTGALVSNYSFTLNGTEYNISGTNTTVYLNPGVLYTLIGNKSEFYVYPQNITAEYTDFDIYLQARSTIMNISVYDEQTDTLLTWRNVTIQIQGLGNNVTYITSTGNKIIQGVTPGEYEFIYFADDYFKRSYYVTLTLAGSNLINLYLLNDSEGTRVYHTLYDKDSNKLEGYTVHLLRYYSEGNEYKTVQMAKTNFQGRAQLYVELYDTYYKLQYTKGSTTYKITNTTFWFDLETEDSIRIDEDEFLSWRGFDDGIFNLTFINSSGQIYARFIFSVDSGLIREGCLNVQRLTATGISTICNNCTSASTGVLTCLIDTTLTGEYKAVGYIDSDTENSWYTPIVSWLKVATSSPIEKSEGIFMTAIIVGTVTITGIASLSGSIILFIIALIISAIISVAYGFGMQIIVYLAVAGILVMMIARRSQ